MPSPVGVPTPSRLVASSVAAPAAVWDGGTVILHGVMATPIAGDAGLRRVSSLASLAPDALGSVGAEGWLDPGPWSSQALLLRIGLPLLLVGIGVGLWAWGRRERFEARAQLGVRSGFGGPPGSTDIGSEMGFGAAGREPDPQAGRARIIGGVIAASLGTLTLIGVLVYRLTS